MDAERQKLHDELRDELFRRQVSNSQLFDKAILSLSSVGLGFSVALIKNVIPLDKATHLCFLHLSWVVFILAIAFTLFSFLTSQLGIEKQLKLNQQYYLLKKEQAINQKNLAAQITGWLSWISFIFYLAALVFTFLFIEFNLSLI